MIRASTPVPRRPAAEAELLDAMLRILRGKRPLSSAQVVALVRPRTGAAAVDIRMMLCPPYFKLLERGWVCTWRLR
jgi:hypothetical protein